MTNERHEGEPTEKTSLSEISQAAVVSNALTELKGPVQEILLYGSDTEKARIKVAIGRLASSVESQKRSEEAQYGID